MFNPLLGRLAKRLAELTPGDLQDLVLRQQRNRSGRRRAQARARRDGAREVRRHARRVSRQDVRRALGKRARGVSRAVRAAARRRRARRRSAIARAGRARRRLRPRDRRAGARRGRRERAAAGVPARRARAVRPFRRAVHRRRSADRTRPLRRAVRLRSGDGVVPDVMTLAKGLSGGVMPIGAYVARAERLERRLREAPAAAHLDLRRQPARVRRGAGRARRAGRGRSRRQRARARRRAARGGARDRRALPAMRFAEVRGLGLLVGVELTQRRVWRNDHPGIAQARRHRGVDAQPAARHPPRTAADRHRARRSRRRCGRFDEAVAVALERLGSSPCPS